MCLEAERIRKNQPEVHIALYCHMHILKGVTEDRGTFATSPSDMSWSCQKNVMSFLESTYANAINNVVARVLLTLTAGGFLGACIHFIMNKEIGYQPSELFDQNDPSNRALELVFTKFPLFAGYLCFQDLEIAYNQGAMLELYDELVNSKTQLTAGHVFPPWPTWLRMLLEGGAAKQATVNNTLNTTRFIELMVGYGFDLTQPSSVMPYGPLLASDAKKFWEFFNFASTIPPADNAYTALNKGLYENLDLVFVNEFQYKKDQYGLNRMTFSFFPLFLVNMEKESLFLIAIADHEAKIAASPIKDYAFVYGDITTYWTVFLILGSEIFKLLLIGTGVIFVLTLVLFSFDPVAAIITSASCFMITLEIYGLSCAFMSFNIFVAAIVLMSLGLSVEFTAHLAAAFSLGRGSIRASLGEGMAHTFPAMVNGSVSTLLSILPLMLHDLLFVVKYLFYIVAMATFVGLINGVLFMPALLAFMGPLATVYRKLIGRGGDDSPSSESFTGMVVQQEVQVAVDSKPAPGPKDENVM